MIEIRPIEVALAALALAAPCSALSDLQLEWIAGDLDQPLTVAGPADEPERLFIVEQAGHVELFLHGVRQATPFLDLSGLVSAHSQGGLLGFVLHPDYSNTGYVYAYFMSVEGTARLVRYTRSSTVPDVADPASALLLVEIDLPVDFHQGGGMAFGPDGRLYLGVGDQRDLPGSTCTAQQGDLLVGKLLRLADDGSIPPDNPFVGDPTVRDEIFAFGLRMPYRIAFDDLTDELLVFDVGEGDAEEIDVLPLSSAAGANFGWRQAEGSLCTGSASCSAMPCPDPSLIEPAYTFAHTFGHCCIIGGAAYRGTSLPSLAGHVLFADWCTGDIWSAEFVGGRLVNLYERTDELWGAAGGAGHPTSISAVGDDLYLLDGGSGQPGDGDVYRFASVPSPFENLGHALDGIFGAPSLSAGGSLGGGQNVSLRLTGADVSTTTSLVIGFSRIDAPFKGGVLVPAPDFVLGGLPVDAFGKSVITFVWPAGVPSGASVVFQHWIHDSASPTGLAASNGLLATAP